MPTLSRIAVNWAGSPVVGPGATISFCNAGDENVLIGAWATFFNAIRGIVPSTVQWSFPTSGNTVDELSGNVNGSWSATAVGAVSSNAVGTWANGVGCRVRWPTIGVVGGRHVIGTTFIVPLAIAAYEGAGNLVASTISTLQTAAGALAATPNGLRIYSRKTSTHGGVSFPVLAASVPDTVSWLRSRRT